MHWILNESKCIQNITGNIGDGVVHSALGMAQDFIMEMILELGLERMWRMIQNYVSYRTDTSVKDKRYLLSLPS